MGSKSTVILLALVTGLAFTPFVQNEEIKPDDPFFAPFHPLKAPPPMRHYLVVGDRLAICGDSITEQKKYSRIMETYLTVCAPELNISVRQYGWSGEKAPGFLARMTNDCLRFKPTIATTCYGMNDHEYRAYEDRIGAVYQSNSIAIDEAFKKHGARVVEGSAGCVGKTPTWVGDRKATVQDLNMNLCQLRNIGLQVAKRERVAFADIFWPMLVEGHEAQLKYGTNYNIAGMDGVHPNWAGHVVMAYEFLRQFGLDGDIGTFTVDMKSKRAKVSPGHELLGFKDGELRIRSHRYPFCIGEGDVSKDDNIHSGTMLVPFNSDLNRMILIVKRPRAGAYKITWGDESKVFKAQELARGINLAQEFLVNPFSDAFNKVDEAVAAKQAFETDEIKKHFHGDDGKADMEGTVLREEEERRGLVAAVKAAFVPVTHTIKIEPQ
ncbi:MAG TPA: SGNH/GDSL hydrolase family protein [Verrucomicrobiae bacterium]|nr:SGNH/GDSL hydrolase family protein [Verrucomicrobiae bacterium]